MKVKFTLATALALAITTAAPSAVAQPYESCYRSKYGPDDQIGALNTLTSAMTLAAAKLVKQGKAIGGTCR